MTIQLYELLKKNPEECAQITTITKQSSYTQIHILRRGIQLFIYFDSYPPNLLKKEL